MNTSLNAPKSCPKCGRPIPSGAPAGLCPACLLAQGAETEGAGHRPRFEPPPLETVAALFPRLELISLLGAGGMGAVYKARQPDLDRFVALKLLPKDGSDGVAAAERFNREARALARLNHPNIVAVHEFGQVEGLHFFLMEFVDGANLRQMEQAGRLSAREALQLIPQICDALQYAHDEGVVHRDIKPENVLVDRKGRVKIADFGLAKIVGAGGESTRLTVDGQVMGTPHYMAPEQVERPLAVDHRADIYSLGVVFYEMLTGDLPIGKFAPPSRKVELDVRLDEIVLRALENDPERRYQRASEVKTRVTNVAETPGEASRPGEEPTAPTGEKFLRWAGIPVVVERNGEREVSFNGALGLVATVLMVVAAAFLTVHLVTGEEHTSTKKSLVLAGWTVFLIIRSTLNRKAPEPILADNGTVVLPPKPRRPYLWHQVSLVALFAGVIGIHVLFAEIIPSWRNRSEIPADVRAKRDPSTGRPKAILPNGGSVEVLALSEANAAPNQWWSPDGRPLTNEMLHLAAMGTVTRDTPTDLRDLIIQFRDLPSGASGPDFDFGSGVPWTGGGGNTVFANGEPLRGAWAVRAALPQGQDEARLRVGFALDPWQTIATHDARSQNSSQIRHPADPSWQSFIHRASENSGSAQITLLLGARDPNWRTRVVAIDTNGVSHDYTNGEGTPAEKSEVWSYVFGGLPLAAVKEFQVQVRPMNWFVFRDLPLKPSSPLPAPQPLRFAETLELKIEDLADLDTGKLATAPPDQPGTNPLAGIGESILWAQNNGFDVWAGSSGLDVLGVEFAVVADTDWDTLTPLQVIDSVSRGRFAPKLLRPDSAPNGGRTFSYQTREHGFGLLQFAPTQEPGRITIRLKRVIR